ncbi:MAG: hypothetical protein H6595_04920 [Flavobacteriales bacterium]|nr:hypothetical protein [Flavobacteriales bacterium]MCB9166804.1 hypothetical protein [Flavobacteriales bacterium]
MRLKTRTALLRGGLVPALVLPLVTTAQDGLQVHGNFSSDAQYYTDDEEIGAVAPAQDLGVNAWGNVIFTYGRFQAGVRLESYEPALLGYPAGQPYKGSGLGYRYVSYETDDLEVTVGNFYEQFGQGLVLRSYEERYLGVDNALDGVRVRYRPVPGLYLKGLIGRQRFGFDNGATKGPGIVRGFDGELSLAEAFGERWTCTSNLVLGGSFVSKYQEDKDPLYVLPENVGAWAARLNFTTPKWNIYSEYAHKINDPNGKNGFIYKDGNALLVNATYSTRGLGISAGAHSFDNMFFQSDRAAPTPFDLNINFLPPLAKQHTYNLPATLYPYATQPNGEVSYQGEVFYKFKKGTPLGGKYGTKLAVNASTALALDTTVVPLAGDSTRTGYRTNSIFNFNTDITNKYFTDINVELRKKVSANWELALTYLYLEYDIDVIQGKPGKPMVFANIAVLEGLHNFTERTSLRFEVQHLWTKQDHGNWATLLAELTFSPHWFVAVMDQFDYATFNSTFPQEGDPQADTERIHYPLASVGYIRGANRFQLSYGRQRAGIFCVGGVCRQVPAANGLTLSITSTF